MDKVGSRELRLRLREYLTRVEAGQEFEVTLFGRSIAHLEPVRTGADGMARFIAEGKVTPPIRSGTTPLPVPVPATTGITATEALLAERRGDAR